MKTLLLLGLFLLSLQASGAPAYFGVKSTEAILRFNSTIEINVDRAISLDQIKNRTPRGMEVLNAIDYQLSFLIGHFQSKSFTKAFRYPGVLGDKKTLTVKSISPAAGGRQLVSYTFYGKVNFQTTAFSFTPDVRVPLRLPLNPYTIYAQAVVSGKSRCSDEHYNSEGDFFYFWDTDQPGCPLRRSNPYVLEFEGGMTKLENTKSTYPEYDRLYSQEKLSISVIVGFINGVNPSRLSKKDEGYASFTQLGQKLSEAGFNLTAQGREGINHLQTYQKQLTNAFGVQQTITLNLILADSETDANGTFTKRFKWALENSQIVAYDGHSGLGGYLDIVRFPRLRLPNFYQIFFFNGCSSYPYYNSMYFASKSGGSKNLEILTAGLPTLTSTSVSNMMAFLSPFISGRVTSYQTLLRNLERSNEAETTYLMGINGDEDNHWRP